MPPVFSITGQYLARRGYWQKFTKRCRATDERSAKEWALSIIGSTHHVARPLVRIDQVEEVPA